MYSILYSAIREIANALAMGIFKLGFDRTFSKNSTEYLTKIGTCAFHLEERFNGQISRSQKFCSQDYHPTTSIITYLSDSEYKMPISRYTYFSSLF